MADIRCTKCGKKLGEHAIEEGSVSLICTRKADKYTPACKTVNIVTIHRDTKNENAI